MCVCVALAIGQLVSSSFSRHLTVADVCGMWETHVLAKNTLVDIPNNLAFAPTSYPGPSHLLEWEGPW